MKESNDIYESISNKSIKKGSESKDIKEPIYEMTIESEKGRKEIINIYSDSKPEEIAYNFCKENNLDFETLELMTNQIKKLMKIITNKKEEKQKNNVENENKLFDCNEPILEDSEEQQSVSAEKIMKTKSFKENIMKKKDKNLNKNPDDKNMIEVDKMNVDNNFKIDGNFKEKQKNSKTSTIITNTINNCMEIIEKEEKYTTSSNSTFSSKIGVSSIHNKQYSLNSKENIPLSDFCKEKEKIDEEINKKNIQSFSYSNNNNHNINQSKSFVNRIPKSTRNDLNINSGNMNDANNSNYNIKQKINNIEIDSNIKTESEECKNSYKIKSLKNSHINNKINSLDSASGYEYYCNKQKEIIKNNKKKTFQRIINMIKKNNIDINQLSTESLTKSNNLSKKKKIENINNEKKIKNKPNGIINQKNKVYFGINNKRNNLRINSINSNYIKNLNGVYYDTNDKDQLYSLSKNEDTSTLNNIIKNSMSINNNYFSNLNSIKHEINMTILSKPKKQIINVPTPKNRNNIIIIKKYNKKNNRNYHTLTEGNINMKCSSQDKIKDFKKKIFNSKSKNSNIKNNNNNKSKSKSKSKKSPVNNNSKINKIKKNYNSTNNNIELNYPLLTKQFFNVTNLKKYRNNFRSPQHKANTMKTTLKNFIIKNSKTNMNKDSFINNNKILLSQSSRTNNINDYSSYIKQRCNSFNDFNSNINNIFINLKYSNNKKNKSLLGYLDNNSGILPQQNKKKINKKRNNSHVFSSNKICNNTNSFGNKKSANETSDKAIINNMNLNLNITAETNNNSYSFKNKRKINNNNFANLKNKIINKCPTNINNKRPCYFFVESQNSSSPSTSRGKIKKNHNALFQNSSLTINLLKKNKIVEALKEIFYYLSNNSDKIDVLKINKKNLIIPEEIIKPIQKIILNCKSKNNNIIIKDFILKGVLLFDSLLFEEKISILNFNYDKIQ